MVKILITGSEGFIGRHLVKRLRKVNEFQVFTIDSKGKGLNHYSYNLSSAEAKEKILSLSPEVIIHLAGHIDVSGSMSSPAKSLADNAIIGLEIIQMANVLGSVNIIYMNSGGATYKETNDLPYTEESLIEPSSPYGVSKQVVEDVLKVSAKLYGYSWTSLALSNCFGNLYEDQVGVVSRFNQHFRERTSPTIYGVNSSRDFVHIDDVIEAILFAIERPANRRVNISSNIEYNLLQLFECMSCQVESQVKPKIVPPRPGEVLRSRLDNTLALQLWGWKPKQELFEVLKGLSVKSINDKF